MAKCFGHYFHCFHVIYVHSLTHRVLGLSSGFGCKDKLKILHLQTFSGKSVMLQHKSLHCLIFFLYSPQRVRMLFT